MSPGPEEDARRLAERDVLDRHADLHLLPVHEPGHRGAVRGGRLHEAARQPHRLDEPRLASPPDLEDVARASAEAASASRGRWALATPEVLFALGGSSLLGAGDGR